MNFIKLSSVVSSVLKGKVNQSFILYSNTLLRRPFTSSETDEEHHISIPEDNLNFYFARSGGPGGQNVNKVNTKVVLKLNIENASWIPTDVKERFIVDHANRINNDGELVLASSLTRFQDNNRADVIQKLQEMLDYSATPPKLRVLRTEPTVFTKEKWKREKKHKSEKKQNRKRSGIDDFF
ncbi:hypothetical protein WA158_005490 [Blastocystis sp. Blastoise]